MKIRVHIVRCVISIFVLLHIHTRTLMHAYLPPSLPSLLPLYYPFIPPSLTLSLALSPPFLPSLSLNLLVFMLFYVPRQAAFIQNPDYPGDTAGPEIVTLGHNPYRPNVVSALPLCVISLTPQILNTSKCCLATLKGFILLMTCVY